MNTEHKNISFVLDASSIRNDVD